MSIDDAKYPDQAGWYSDPLNPHRQRYFNGQAWSDDVRELPRPAPLPPSDSVQSRVLPSAPPSKTAIAGRTLSTRGVIAGVGGPLIAGGLGLATLIVVIAVVIAIGSQGSQGSQITVRGEVLARDASQFWGEDCAGSSFIGDSVEVLDSGETLGLSRLESTGERTSGSAGDDAYCVFQFSIDGVDGDRKFYTISVSGGEGIRYSRAELGEPLRLSYT